MRSSYRRIGDYITLVDERNVDLKVTTLLGLSISKQFIPSVANIVGTDMKNYKIIRKNQFACSVMQVRRDGKMPVALLRDYEEAIISQAYPVFEVIDTSLLLPEYLMMWFTRSEFDRQATFHAVGGVRGSLEWEDFMDFELPIPTIETQQEIVNEYQTITKRIELSQQLNQKLEETAQALYKHWFVDFEFPNEQGEPYKSSCGAMVYNEELDVEIPEGWEVTNVEDTVDIIRGASPRPINEYMSNEGMSWVKISDATACINKFLFETKEYIKIEGVSKSRVVEPETLILSNSASPGLPRIMKIKACVHDGWLIFNNYEKVSREFIFQFLLANKQDILSNSNGSVFKNLKTEILKKYRIVIPKKEILKKYSILQQKIDVEQENKSQEIKLLNNLINIILSKMAVGSEREIVTN